MAQGLYYPLIDIPNEKWLKTSLLYWDSLRTIVPESINDPYLTDTGKALESAGYLIPLRVQSGMDEIEDLTDDVLSYMSTEEGSEMLLPGFDSRLHDLHLEKLPYRLMELFEIHPDKLPSEIRNMFQEYFAPSSRGTEWVRVGQGFANFYMTLLASRLSERIGARLLTSIPAADRLAVSARLDAKNYGQIPWFANGPVRRWKEYGAFGPRRVLPKELAPGMLATLAFERIAVAADTPVERLIEFREHHRDELGLFRSKIDELAAAISSDMPEEAFRQGITDLYEKEVVPAISNLKGALDGRRIRWMSNGLLKVAFFSVGPSSMLMAAGLNVPTALLAGAGLSLVVSGTMFNVEKTELLRANPFAYLLSIERELGTTQGPHNKRMQRSRSRIMPRAGHEQAVGSDPAF